MNDSKEKSLHNYSTSQNRCADIKRWQVTQASRTIKRQWDGIPVTVSITVRLGVERCWFIYEVLRLINAGGLSGTVTGSTVIHPYYSILSLGV